MYRCNIGVGILRDHLSAFSELVEDHTDQIFGELKDSIYCWASVHAEGLPGEIRNICSMNDRPFVNGFFKDGCFVHSIQTIIGDSVVLRTVAHPTTDKQVVYNGLLETFEGNETAVYGVMCALVAESGCSPTATEATGKWGVSAADYTAQVNDGTVSKEEFINSTYNGVQGARGYGIAQWSTTGRKKALYEFAESWATEKGETFDIGGIDMQVAHLQETINTSYASMKESLIKEKDMVKACYLWIATYEKPSEKYSTWQEKAENDVDNFEEDLRAECSVSANKGIFLWPCPSSNHITSYFGNRTPPKKGASSDHKGIDIGASMGAQVIAAAAGKVTTVAYSGARGYYIVVDHGNGYETLYQHLSRQDVRMGEMVKVGQQIGAVGETGISTAPHLHFEIHVNGIPVDPLQYYK